MITRFSVENFKSYRRAELPLGPLTLLVGANASGKTNLLEALRLLAALADGQRLDDLFASIARGDLGIRGDLADLVHHMDDLDARVRGDILLGCHLESSLWPDFSIQIRVGRDEMHVVQERVTSPIETVPLYEIKEPASEYRHEVQVAYNNFARGGRKPLIYCSDQRAIFTQLDVPSRFNGKRAPRVIPGVATAYQDTFRSIQFYDFEPATMRGYSSIVDDELWADGANISSVLYALCYEPEGQQTILDFIRDLPEQDIRGLDFHGTPRAEVMLRLNESFGPSTRLRDAPILSDGTLRVLAIAAALLSSPPGALVVLEEIDNGVHPSRAGQLLANIHRVATARGLSVLLTSHNPALLDAVPVESVPDIVACYRDPDEGDSRLVRLDDLAEYPDLVARGPIGRLMTDGVLERTLHRRQTEAERKAEARRQAAAFLARTETAEAS